MSVNNVNNLTVCTPGVSDCGGHGICEVTGECTCSEFWSTKTDFVDFEICATNVIAIYILWTINLLLLLWVCYSSASVIVFRFENFFEQKKHRKNYTLWHNKGLIGVLLNFVFSIPFQFAMVFVQFADPLTRVGFDWAPTMLFFLAKAGFYTSIIFTQGPMLASALKGDPNQQHLVRMGYISNTIASVLSIIIGALPLATITVFQENTFGQITILQTYYYSQSIAMFILGLLSLVIKNRVTNALSGADNIVSSDAGQQKKQDIVKKVNDLQNGAFRQASVQGIIYLLLGAVPFFWVYHKYFLPLSWLALPLLAKKLAFNISLDKKGARSVMQRLGIQKTSQMGDNTTGKDSSQIDGIPNSSRMLHNMTSRQQGSSYASETTQMEELLSPDHPHHEQFLAYVKSRYATNELELLQQCILYKRATSSKQRTKIGEYIMNNFIKDDSPKTVDVPDGVKRILISTAARKMYADGTFDAVRGPLIFDIKGNFVQGFEKKMSSAEFSTPGNSREKKKSRGFARSHGKSGSKAMAAVENVE